MKDCLTGDLWGDFWAIHKLIRGHRPQKGMKSAHILSRTKIRSREGLQEMKETLQAR